MNKQLITIFSIFSITCLGMVSAQESKSFLPEVKKESLTFSSEDNKFKPVSYTHLTLPTT